MSRRFTNWDERALDLAIDRFTVGQDGRDRAALDHLVDEADLQELENTFSAIHLASLRQLEAPPADLMDCLERGGREHVAAGAPAPGRVTPLPPRALAYGGWLAAAALLVAFFVFGRDGDVDTNALRASLIAEADDLVRIEWTATEDPAASEASGDVVWSSSLQEGYMRFSDLAPNDPEQTQYQLWIFDPTRADWEARPVDGGVFDVPAGGEVVVPIDAKLAVRETALFAVTVEVPGGVVVSERERLVLTAAL